MPRVSSFELVCRNDQPTISITTRTPLAHLPGVIGMAFEKLAEYLREFGERPEDTPYIAYRHLDENDMEVEIGFPVTSPMPNKNGVEAGIIPAGEFAMCFYRGAYRDMTPVYRELGEWIAGQSLVQAGPYYEYYLNGPDYPENELLTKIVLPVEKA